MTKYYIMYISGLLFSFRPYFHQGGFLMKHTRKTLRKSLAMLLSVIMIMGTLTAGLSALAAIDGVPTRTGVDSFFSDPTLYGAEKWDKSTGLATLTFNWDAYSGSLGYDPQPGTLIYSYPSHIYLNVGETLEAAGYMGHMTASYGENDGSDVTDFRILLSSATWGESTRSGFSDVIDQLISGYGHQGTCTEGSKLMTGSSSHYDFSNDGRGSDQIIRNKTSENENFESDKESIVVWRSNTQWTGSNMNNFDEYVLLKGTANKAGEVTFNPSTNFTIAAAQRYTSFAWHTDNGARLNRFLFNNGSRPEAAPSEDALSMSFTVYDKSELNTMVAAADAYYAANGSYEGYAVLDNLNIDAATFASRLTAAKAVLVNREVSQADIDTAAASIGDRMTALISANAPSYTSSAADTGLATGNGSANAFNAVAYHCQDPATGTMNWENRNDVDDYAELVYGVYGDAYRNLVYAPFDQTEWIEKEWHNCYTTLATPRNVVMVYDGVSGHEPMSPIMMQLKGNGSNGPRAVDYLAVADTNSNLQFKRQWAGYMDESNNGYLQWPDARDGRNGITFNKNSYINYQVRDRNDLHRLQTENQDNKNTRRDYGNAFVYVGSGDTSNYYEQFHETQLRYSHTWYSWTGNSVDAENIPSKGDIYVINYQPIYYQLDEAAAVKAIIEGDTSWQYTEASIKRVKGTIMAMIAANPKNYDYDTNVAQGVADCAAAIKDAVYMLDNDGLTLEKKTGTVRFVSQTGETLTINGVDAEYTREYGATVAANEIPQLSNVYCRTDNAQWDYSEDLSWDPALPSTIVFDEPEKVYQIRDDQTVQEYTVTFFDNDGTTVLAAADWQYGEYPDYGGTLVKQAGSDEAIEVTAPIKDTAEKHYVLTGWTDGEDIAFTGLNAMLNKFEVATVEGSTRDNLDTPKYTQYTAVYTESDHDFGEVSYVWGEDNATCTATRVCSVCGRVETETVGTTNAVDPEPNCTVPGTRTFTAEFTNSAFGTKTTTEEVPVVETAHDWQDNWVGGRTHPHYDPAELSTVNPAVNNRVCQNNPAHTDTVEVYGATHYTTGEPNYKDLYAEYLDLIALCSGKDISDAVDQALTDATLAWAQVGLNYTNSADDEATLVAELNAAKIKIDDLKDLVDSDENGVIDDGALKDYTIIFKKENGDEISSSSYKLNATVTVPEAPVKSDAQYTYTFAGWIDEAMNVYASDEIPAVTGNATYTAKYSDQGTTNNYTIYFVYVPEGTDAVVTTDGQTLAYDAYVTFPATAATYRDQTEVKTFVKWIDSEGAEVDPESTTVSKNETYTASYEATGTAYYTRKVIARLGDTGIDITLLEWNDMQYNPNVSISVVTSDPEDIRYEAQVWTFDHWEGDYHTGLTVPCTGDDEFIAVFRLTDEVANYTVEFVNNNGERVAKKTDYTFNQAADVPATPFYKPRSIDVDYTFLGWSDGETLYAADEIPAVTADATYTAVYESESHARVYPVDWEYSGQTQPVQGGVTEMAYGHVITEADLPTRVLVSDASGHTVYDWSSLIGRTFNHDDLGVPYNYDETSDDPISFYDNGTTGYHTAGKEYIAITYEWAGNDTDGYTACVASMACSVCGELVTEVSNAANGNFQTFTTNPTNCTETKKITYKAMFDGSNFETQWMRNIDTGIAGSHDFNWYYEDNPTTYAWTFSGSIPVSCTATQKCHYCNSVDTETADAEFVRVKTEATCVNVEVSEYEAYFTKYPNGYGEFVTAPIDPDAHDWDYSAVDEARSTRPVFDDATETWSKGTLVIPCANTVESWDIDYETWTRTPVYKEGIDLAAHDLVLDNLDRADYSEFDTALAKLNKSLTLDIADDTVVYSYERQMYNPDTGEVETITIEMTYAQFKDQVGMLLEDVENFPLNYVTVPSGSEYAQYDEQPRVDEMVTTMQRGLGYVYNDDGTVKDGLLNKYTVTFTVNGVTTTYSDLLKDAIVDVPAAPASIDGHDFLGWTVDGTNIALAPSATTYTVAGDAAFTAKYSDTASTITITWIDAGEPSTTSVAYGATPTHDLPSKEDDTLYTYSYAWDPEIVPAVENTTYTAIESKTYNDIVLAVIASAQDILDEPDGYTTEYLNTIRNDLDILDDTKLPVASDAQKIDALNELINLVDVAYLTTVDTTALSSAITAATPKANNSQKYTEASRNLLTQAINDGSLIVTKYNGKKIPVTQKEAAEEEISDAITAINNAVAALVVREYPITFVDENGTTVLKSSDVAYDEVPTAPADPTKADGELYKYKFSAWDPEIVAVTGEATYTATYETDGYKQAVQDLIDQANEIIDNHSNDYDPDYIDDLQDVLDILDDSTEPVANDSDKLVAVSDLEDLLDDQEENALYVITFYGYNNAVLQDQKFKTGVTPIYYAETDPSRPDSKLYTYRFDGWDPELAPVSGAASYNAKFIENGYNQNVVDIINDADEIIADADDTTTGNDYDPEYIQNIQDNLDILNDNTKTDEEKEQALSNLEDLVSENGIANGKLYTIRFIVEGVAAQSYQLKKGETPAWTGAAPTKDSSGIYSYSFKEWNPAIIAVTGDADYTATFNTIIADADYDAYNTAYGKVEALLGDPDISSDAASQIQAVLDTAFAMAHDDNGNDYKADNQDKIDGATDILNTAFGTFANPDGSLKDEYKEKYDLSDALDAIENAENIKNDYTDESKAVIEAAEQAIIDFLENNGVAFDEDGNVVENPVLASDSDFGNALNALIDTLNDAISNGTKKPADYTEYDELFAKLVELKDNDLILDELIAQINDKVNNPLSRDLTIDEQYIVDNEVNTIKNILDNILEKDSTGHYTDTIKDSALTYYTVMFVWLNKTEVQRVLKGGTATPPSLPAVIGVDGKADGHYVFNGWDNDQYIDVRENMVINAVLELEAHTDSDKNNKCEVCGCTIDNSFQCGMCPFYKQNKDIPVIGWFITIIHFFVHLAQSISHIT